MYLIVDYLLLALAGGGITLVFLTMGTEPEVEAPAEPEPKRIQVRSYTRAMK